MDAFGLEEEKRKEISSHRLRLVFAVVFAAAVLGFGVYVSVYGINAPKDFFQKIAVLALEAFHDTLGLGGGEKLAAEIDLNGGSQPSSLMISETALSGAAEGYAGEGAISAPQVPNDGNGEGASADGASGNSSSISLPEAGSEKISVSSGTAAKASSDKSAKTSSAPVAPVCPFATGGSLTRGLIFSEIAWMGSVPQTGETATHAATREWLELKNISRDDIDLAGWQISDGSGRFKIVFVAGEKLSAGGFYLFERATDDSVPGIKANKIYSGVLANSGMSFRLFDADCALVDAIDASSGWPAGDNAMKATMERNAGDLGWHTSASPGGTPKTENSVPIVAANVSAATTTTTTAAATTTATTSTTAAATIPISSAESYIVGVSFQGDGSGIIISSPSGIYCGTDCLESYVSGTLLTLTAMPDTGSGFVGWSGPCGGTGVCVFAVNGTESVVGIFKSLVQALSAPSSDEDNGGQTSSSAPAAGSVVISEIFYDAVGSDTGKEFIEFYNRGATAVDLSGWSLKNGANSLISVGSKTEDKTGVNGGGYFLVGFSSYNSTPPADAVRSASLPNTTTTIVFYDAGGGVVDSVTYPASCSGCILSPGQSYERQPLSGDQFVVEPNPNPQNSGN